MLFGYLTHDVLQVVREMPSGQAIPMLTFIADSIPCLTATQSTPAALAAIGQVLVSCLASVRVELIPAPNLAQAVSNLLTTSLAPTLQPLLSAAVNTQSPLGLSQVTPGPSNLNSGVQHAQREVSQQVGDSNLAAQHAQHGGQDQAVLSQSQAAVGGEQLLGCLLQLYRGAVKVHGQCAAMQPQIDPLHGQAVGLPNQGSLAADHQGTTTHLILVSAAVCCHAMPSAADLWTCVALTGVLVTKCTCNAQSQAVQCEL